VAIFEALNVVVWFVESIRRDPHDQVLRFEALAFATFVVGLLLLKLFGLRWPLGLVWLALFFGFTGGWCIWLLRLGFSEASNGVTAMLSEDDWKGFSP
jgi:hypothetical protein